jgi:tRNA threonylcarbamoyladenosine biosynthesis protein TsaB
VNVLAVDTATEALGLALRTGEHTRSELVQAGFRHSETLLPHARRLLQDAGLQAAQLELIVCSLGPGSFTGIRIGLAAVKGLAFAARPGGVPLCGASTLEGLAWRYRRLAFPVAVVNASLRRAFHAGLFRGGLLEGEYREEGLEELAARLAEHPRLALAGSGAERLYERLAALRGPDGLLLDASPVPADPVGLLEMGLERFRLHGPTPDPLPLYLRGSQAEISRQAGPGV